MLSYTTTPTITQLPYLQLQLPRMITHAWKHKIVNSLDKERDGYYINRSKLMRMAQLASSIMHSNGEPVLELN